ncbi:serine protease [Lentzea aerocolonigenes]|uniref:Serine protease n=1 Tax=Lentzea aerocolonigenes TaxID=68170 RepID=A0A0F0GL43_LENAE|nr:serine protease [Lentzea aerocolonigenes]
MRPGTPQSSAEAAVLWLVNEVRRKAGLGKLRCDERLRAAARNHSKDMARRDFCEHVNPDGVTPVQRMSAAGYPDPGAENVARGQPTPHAVMTAWLASPGHRANLLNREFATIGIGVELGRGGPYWTQNFGY